MKTYSVFIIVPEAEKKKVKLADFDSPNVSEIIIMGRKDFKYDVRLMLRSQLVVTAGEWHEDPNCNKAVSIARIMEQEVIHETNYQKYVEQKYN